MLMLLLAVTSNDDDALFIESLYEKYHTLMYRAAMMRLNQNEAEDAVQNAVLSLLKSVDTLRCLDEKAQKAYIYVTVRNECNMIWRAQKRSPFIDVDVFDMPAVDDQPDATIMTRCGVEDIKGALKQLPDEARDLLYAKMVLNKSDEEIAESLGIKTATVRVKLHRIRNRIRELLKEVATDGR